MKSVPATIKSAPEFAYIGGLSNPSKLDTFAYSLPATDCKTGSTLAQTPGTVCHGCYALTNFYRMPNVKAALARRLESLSDLPRWTNAMAMILHFMAQRGLTIFRWHDSGDVQSMEHLEAIGPIRPYTIVRKPGPELQECPATATRGTCNGCTTCWDDKPVSYRRH